MDIAGVFVERDGKYLLVQEKKVHVYGLWNLPAGHVEENETFEQAAKREGEEETGYDLKLGEKIDTFPLKDGNKMHVFKAVIVGGEIEFDSDELIDVKWFTPEEIKQLPLREQFINTLF